MARAEVDALVLQVSADVRRMEKAMEKMAGDVDKRTRQVENRFNKMNSHIKQSGDRMASDLTRTFAAIGVIAAVRGLTDAADKWTALRNSVGAYQAVVGPTTQATERLKQVADDAGVAATSLGTTFAASARAAKTLGASTSSIFAFNEAVAKGAQIANTGAAAVDGALTQLGQAIGSPKVQLGEFNSVIEGTPRLAQAFADGIQRAGGSVAKLRELITKGEIAGSDLFEGLISQLPTLRKEFAASEVTISRSVNRIGNAYLQYVGNADRAMGVSQQLSGFLNLVADNFQLLADAAIVAAGVMGGALALGAMIRFLKGLKDMVGEANRAQSALTKLRLAATFFTGPLGAAMLAIGTALGVMALNTGEAAQASETAADAYGKLESALAEVKTDTEAMEAAQKRLTTAINEGSEAAQRAGVIDLELSRQKLLASKQLAQSEAIRLRQAREAKEEEQFKKSDDVRSLLDPFGVNSVETSLNDRRKAMEDVMRRKYGLTNYDQFAQYFATQAQTGPLNEGDKYLFDVLQEVQKFRQELADIDRKLAEAEKFANLADVGNVIEFPGATGGEGSASAKAAKGYRTELEKLRETLRDLRKEQGEDASLLQQGVMAYDSLQVNGQAAEDYAQKLLDAGEKLEALEKNASERSRERSRRAVQAIIDLGNSDLKAAFDQIPSLSDILTGGDEKLLRAKLGEMAKAAADGVAAGTDKIAAEFETAVRAVEAARSAAIASGVTDLAMFDRALQELFDKLDADLEERIEAPMPYDLAQIQRDMEDIDVPEFVDEFESLRQGVRDGMRAGLREGIQTDNWGQALRNAVAESVLGGFNDAIDRAADLLTDVITGKNPIANQLWNWATGGMFKKGPGRAAGGNMSPFTRHQVNESGVGEFVFLGKNPAKALTAAQINGMVSGGRKQGATTVDARMTVMGSIDAVTWPKVEAAMRMQAHQIMSSVPGAVNATLIDNRVQQRRI